MSRVGVGDRKRGVKRERMRESWIDGSAVCWDTIRINQAKGLGLSHLKRGHFISLIYGLPAPQMTLSPSTPSSLSLLLSLSSSHRMLASSPIFSPPSLNSHLYLFLLWISTLFMQSKLTEQCKKKLHGMSYFVQLGENVQGLCMRFMNDALLF